MLNSSNSTSGGVSARPQNQQNYKFQRLREAIRRAVLSGEYEDRLPGERQLGRHYNANAKTVNKALSDLCSEGLLVRHIGRGTFIARHANGGTNGARRKQFQILVASGGSVVCREAILGETRRRFVAAGHRLNESAEAPCDDRRIPLSSWPTIERSRTSGLICYSGDPLSGRTQHLADACLAEAYRRHVPVVIVGACSPSAKANAVVPDYLDAGFQLSEHLSQLGCIELAVATAAPESREIERVVAGCRASGIRRRRSIVRIAVNETDPELTDRELSVLDRYPQTTNSSVPRIGMVCVGALALRRVWAHESVGDARRAGRLAIACVLEPGVTIPEALAITSYQVEPRRIADWVLRLLHESRPGQRPVEVIMPGGLSVRPDSIDTPANNASQASGGAVSIASGGPTLAEAVI